MLCFLLCCKSWNCRCSCMGNVHISSRKCCIFMSCVHPVVVPNAAFCMTCSLLMLLEDAIGDHMEDRDLWKEPARWRSLL